MSGKFNIDAYLKQQRESLSKTIDQATKGSMGERMKHGLQEVVSKDSLKKAGIAAGAGAVVSVPVPIVGPITGAAIGFFGYLGLKAYRAYNDLKTDDYSM